MSPPRVLASLAASSLVAAGCAGVPPDLSAGLDVTTKYVARGALLFDDPAFQPSVTATFESEGGSWTVGEWASIDGTNRDGHGGEATELDLFVERAQPIGPFSVAAGLYEYLYPASGDSSTGEVYGTISYEHEFATPTFQLWYDHDEADGVYANLDLSRTIDLSETWSLSISVSSGWMSSGQAEYYFGVDEDGFSDLTGSTALSWSASDAVGVTVSLNAARVLDEDFRDTGQHPDNAWLVLSVEFGF